MKHALTMIATAAFALGSSHVSAGPSQSHGARVSGADLAASVCAQCHAVSSDASKHSPDPQAPRFRDVAAMPSTTELSIKVFLRSSHRNMPNLMLNDEEIGSIADYILSLRK